jgi:2-keto-4-pentenoate hydratase/2-oxohepta-3-ene-1,7-dioic acid hydratase in catechol pathway
MKIAFPGGAFTGRLAVLDMSGAAETMSVLRQGISLAQIASGVTADMIDVVLPRSEVVLAAPIVSGARILCVGLNFRTHAEEAKIPLPAKPSLFARFASSLAGPDEPITLPRVSASFDFEGELAVVIGRAGRHIREEDAFDHVLGYSCFADNSLRDWQNHSRQITPGKNFDRSGAIGPWLVTRDEIPDVGSLEIETFVNGVRRQHGTIDDMIFSIPYVIAYVSTFMELCPGDILAMGTPAGSAGGESSPNWLKAGDYVEIRISGIGSLKNRVKIETTTDQAGMYHE